MVENPDTLPSKPLDEAFDRRVRAEVSLRAPGLYDPAQLSLLTGVYFDPDEDRTQQQFAEEADINTLVHRFGVIGEIPVPRVAAEYGDFSEVTDLQSALNELIRGQEAFESMPVAIRARFDNDPAKFWTHLHDPANEAELVELGVLKPSAGGNSVPVEPPAPDSGAGGSEGTPS